MPLVSKNFSDIITFTRASTGSYFDSAGVLQSAAINTPRLDYNPSTLAAQGLLIEEQRVNSIRNNTMVGAVVGTPGTLPTNWVANVGGLNYAVVDTGTENGITYVDLRFNGTPTSTGPQTIAADALVSTIGLTWSVSGWIKLSAGSFTNVSQTTLRVASEASGTVFTPSSTLTRYENARTLTTATSAWTLRWNYLDTVTPVDFTLRIGLPQLELGAFATSVIPTSTVAATRSADVASVNTLSPWYNQSEGTVYAEFLAGVSVASQQAVFDIDNSSDILNNRISWRMGNEFVVSAGSTVVNFFITPTASATSKWAFAFTTNDFAFSRNGGAPSTDSSGALPSGLNRMLLGNSNSAANTFLNGYLRRITYYPRRLSNDELQTITA